MPSPITYVNIVVVNRAYTSKCSNLVQKFYSNRYSWKK